MYTHLTQYELYYIWQHKVNKFNDEFILHKQLGIGEIAANLKKHRSTIYRAIKFIKSSNWQPKYAETKFRKRKRKKFNLLKPKIQQYIRAKLEIGWSPEVISGRMYKDIKSKVSFKTIYRYIKDDRIQGGKLYKLLPHHGKSYRYSKGDRIPIANRIDITQRPAIVEKKIRLGDLEGDTVVGPKGGSSSCLLTLVDRASKYAMLRKLPNKTAKAVEGAMNICYDNSILPFLTVTYDNGTEFANHQNISKNLGCDIYFARPYRSSDRGLNEHTNGLARRFFPKKTDFSKITDTQIEHVQNLLNDRPRKVLGFLTPNEVVNKHLTKAYKKMSQLT